MDERITEWVNRLRLTVSERTAAQYAYHVRRLLETSPDRKLEEWTAGQLITLVGERRAAGLGAAMVKQMVCAYRSFFAYLYGANSPAKKVPYPKIHVKRQLTLDAETALKVLASCDRTTHLGTRDLAILTLMLDSGLRSSEVCRLRLDKIDFEKRRFTVVVKGGDEEIGVYSRATARNLDCWLSIRGEHARPGVNTLFVSVGGGLSGSPITHNGLRRIFKRIGQAAGLTAFSPHDLRRTFATIAIRQGAPTRVVQAAGRWGDISLVERYTQEIQAEDFERYSPVEALLNGRD